MLMHAPPVAPQFPYTHHVECGVLLQRRQQQEAQQQEQGEEPQQAAGAAAVAAEADEASGRGTKRKAEDDASG